MPCYGRVHAAKINRDVVMLSQLSHVMKWIPETINYIVATHEQNCVVRDKVLVVSLTAMIARLRVCPISCETSVMLVKKERRTRSDLLTLCCYC